MKGSDHGQSPGGWFINKNLAGGGAVIYHTGGIFDLMRWFLQKRIKSVYAEIDTLIHNMKVDDCGLIMLEFENGVFATIDPSWSRPSTFPASGDVTLEIIGTKGIIYIDVYAQTISVYPMGMKGILWHGWGSNIENELIENFVEMIQYNRSPEITGEDGFEALKIADAAYKSSITKKPERIC